MNTDWLKKEINIDPSHKGECRFLKAAALIQILFFVINPFIFMFHHWIIFDYLYMRAYNQVVLLQGTLVLLLYFMQKVGFNPSRIKELIKQHIPVLLFLLFGFLMIVTTFLNGAPEIAVYGEAYRGEGLLTFLSYIVYFLMAAFMLSDKMKQVVVYVLLASSTIVGCVIFYDYVFLDAKYNFAQGGDMILCNSNHQAYYLLVAIMFYGLMFVTAKKMFAKIGFLVGFMFLTAVLLMNNSWGCQLALFVGVIFTIIVYSVGKGKFQPVTLWLAVAVAVTYLISSQTDDRLTNSIEANFAQIAYDTNAILEGEEPDYATSGTARLHLWMFTSQYIMERPLIGHGSDVTGERLEADSCSDRCHCEFLNYAVSFGIPATIVYIAAIFMVYLRGLRMKEHLTDANYVGLCAAFAYLASSLVGNTMYYTAPFLFIALGMGYAKTGVSR